MEFHSIELGESRNSEKNCLPDTTVWIAPQKLFWLTEKICRDKKCRYPQLTVRILIHVVAGMDRHGRMPICARQISKAMEVHYDTVTKCLKYLREIEVLRIER